MQTRGLILVVLMGVGTANAQKPRAPERAAVSLAANPGSVLPLPKEGRIELPVHLSDKARSGSAIGRDPFDQFPVFPMRVIFRDLGSGSYRFFSLCDAGPHLLSVSVQSQPAKVRYTSAEIRFATISESVIKLNRTDTIRATLLPLDPRRSYDCQVYLTKKESPRFELPKGLPVSSLLQIGNSFGPSRLGKPQVIRQSILSSSPYFIWRRSEYFELPGDKEKGWLRVGVTSSKFDPFIALLDANLNVLTTGHAKKDIDIRRDEANQYLVVTSYEPDFPGLSGEGLPFQVSVKEYPYDPAKGALGQLEYLLSNPLINLVIGGIGALLLSFAFHRLQSDRGKLYVRRISDAALIRPADGDGMDILIKPADEVEPQIVRFMSLVEVEVKYKGPRAIQASEIRHPIFITFGNVVRVLRTSQVGDQKGKWTIDTTEGETNEIVISTEGMFPNDALTVRALCEQAKETSILISVATEIANVETVIINDRARVVKLAHHVSSIAMILIFAVMVVDIFVIDIPVKDGTIVKAYWGTAILFVVTLIWRLWPLIAPSLRTFWLSATGFRRKSI